MLKKLPNTPDDEDLQGENEISLFLKGVKCIGGLSWARLRSAWGHTQGREFAISCDCAEAASSISGYFILSA